MRSGQGGLAFAIPLARLRQVNEDWMPAYMDGDATAGAQP
jgi:hypothetical protein